MMCRRNKPLFQVVVFLGLLAALGYCVFLYNTLTFKLERSERQIRKYIKHQQSLSAQLQVVYEHRARLEKTFEKEKVEHKKTKTELDINKREFLVNFTRTKHETRNRFNSLETQHRMLKAQQEQVQVEYNRLQQQHARLSSEHQTVHQQQLQSYRDLKEQKNNEISTLEEQFKTLKQQTANLRQQASDATYYKQQTREVLEEIQRYKSTITSLNQRLRHNQKLLQQHQANKDIVKEQAQSHRQRNAHKIGAADARPQPPQPQPVVTAKPTLQIGQPKSQQAGREKRTEESEKEEEDEDNDEEVPAGRPGVNVQQKTADQSQGQARPIKGLLDDGGQRLPVHRPIQSQQKSAGAVRQVTPKPLLTKESVGTIKSRLDEADGEPRADADDEQQAEEEKVKQYLSQNLENKIQNTVNQETEHPAAPRQPDGRSLTTPSPSRVVPKNILERADHQEPEQPLAPAHRVQDSRSDGLPRPPEEVAKGEGRGRLTRLHPNMGQVRPPPVRVQGGAERSEQDEGDSDDTKEEDADAPKSDKLKIRKGTNEGDEQSKVGAKTKLDKSEADKVSLELRNLQRQKRVVKDPLEEAGPKRSKDGEQYRRPIPKPGPVTRKAGEEDSEHIEPGENEAKNNDGEQAQEEDNEEGEEDPDQAKEEDDVLQGKPAGRSRPDAGQSDKAAPKPAPRGQVKDQQDQDDNKNEDDAEDDTENERNPQERRHPRIRGLR